jgi:hypothetical protein
MLFRAMTVVASGDKDVCDSQANPVNIFLARYMSTISNTVLQIVNTSLLVYRRRRKSCTFSRLCFDLILLTNKSTNSHSACDR